MSTNCCLPPSRCGASTRRRATLLATAAPWSRRTIWRQRSSPPAARSWTGPGTGSRCARQSRVRSGRRVRICSLDTAGDMGPRQRRDGGAASGGKLCRCGLSRREGRGDAPRGPLPEGPSRRVAPILFARPEAGATPQSGIRAFEPSNAELVLWDEWPARRMHRSGERWHDANVQETGGLSMKTVSEFPREVQVREEGVWIPIAGRGAPRRPHLASGGRGTRSGAGAAGVPALSQTRHDAAARRSHPPLLRRPRLREPARRPARGRRLLSG